MRWTKLTIQNFLSFKEAEIELDNRGIILIEGKNETNSKFQSNGSGKSSLLEALVYAIYDTTSKGIKANDVINRTAGKNTAVILEGYRGEDLYRIERYRKHSKHKNKVLLFVNGQEITEKSTAETNKTIERIVGIDYNTFINSIMFSQGNGAGRFAIATDKEKKEILENLVNLQVYVTAQEVAKERVRAKDEEIRNKKAEGERLQWELSQVDTLEQQDRDNYENTLNLIKQEEKRFDDLLVTSERYAAANFPIVEGIRERIKLLESQRDKHTNVSIDQELSKVNEINQILQNKQAQLNTYNSKKTELVSQYKKVEKDTHCPVCGNELDNAHREKELLSIREQLKGVLIEFNKIDQEITSLKDQYTVAVQEYQQVKAVYDTHNQEYKKIMDEINNCQQQITNYENTMASYRNQLDNLKTTLQKLRSIPQPKSRDEEREVIRGKIKSHKQELLNLEKEKTQLEDVVKVFSNSGVKSHVLDLVTPFLNERANKYLSALSGSDMEIKFSTQTKNKDGSLSDKFDLQLINHAGGESYRANSEGEKKRVDLAVSLALQDLVMSRSESTTNFVVYDEVFDALDSVGSENVVTLLKERLNTVGTIFVISHSEHLKPLFDKTVTVTKNKDGVSTISGGVEK
ncbi:putative exonuclease subunit 2 [Bacillus phage KKP_4048]